MDVLRPQVALGATESKSLRAHACLSLPTGKGGGLSSESGVSLATIAGVGLGPFVHVSDGGV